MNVRKLGPIVRDFNDAQCLYTEKAENGAIPLETSGLVEKPRDKLHVKTEQDAFSVSAAGSSSHNSQSTNSRTSQRTYDKLAFPRQELQTLGMLGASNSL